MTRFVYGRNSRAKLSTVDPTLVKVCERALEITPVDIAIVWGWRDEETQNSMVRMKASRTPWPQSKHNHTLEGYPRSLAVDFAPWVNGLIPWNDTHLFAVVAGVMFSAAEQLKVAIRWGGDWNMNGLTTDQSFMDWGHIEKVD